MSEYLKNQEYKKNFLKGLIKDLHRGRDFSAVKEEFDQFIRDVDAVEIADIEQQLIKEGMPPEEITKLCDVHAAIFKDALDNKQPELLPGHPLYTIKYENGELRNKMKLLDKLINDLTQVPSQENIEVIQDFQGRLNDFYQLLDQHYTKKENIIFPFLEKHNITGPPSVMWSVDDEIRALAKELMGLLQEGPQDNTFISTVRDKYFQLNDKITEMFSKEEDILTPMLKDTLTEEEWGEIKEEEGEFGYLVKPVEADVWEPKQARQETFAETGPPLIDLDVGRLSATQINSLLKHLPLDITFVDKDDEVRYFSQTEERIFTRTKSIIGRKVQNCHPPASVHIVEKIVSDFKSGRQDKAEFWLEMGGKFILIQYLAIRDDAGEYMGTMEVTQNLTHARSLEGERRLLKYAETYQ
ncbi:MAG: DUF438 domain-containing protein [Halanaerobium sp.]|nr:DUF438 domain-containing protein [Halanaerobium sp.]